MTGAGRTPMVGMSLLGDHRFHMTSKDGLPPRGGCRCRIPGKEGGTPDKRPPESPASFVPAWWTNGKRIGFWM